MMDALLTFFTWQFIMFCLGITAITYVVRRLLEFFILDNPKLPGNKNSKFWKELFLPLFPIFIAPILSYFALAFPYPDNIGLSVSGRVIWGLVGGFSATTVVRVIFGMLNQKLDQYQIQQPTIVQSNPNVVQNTTAVQVSVSSPSSPDNLHRP